MHSFTLRYTYIRHTFTFSMTGVVFSIQFIRLFFSFPNAFSMQYVNNNFVLLYNSRKSLFHFLSLWRAFFSLPVSPVLSFVSYGVRCGRCSFCFVSSILFESICDISYNNFVAVLFCSIPGVRLLQRLSAEMPLNYPISMIALQCTCSRKWLKGKNWPKSLTKHTKMWNICRDISCRQMW